MTYWLARNPIIGLPIDFPIMAIGFPIDFPGIQESYTWISYWFSYWIFLLDFRTRSPKSQLENKPFKPPVTKWRQTNRQSTIDFVSGVELGCYCVCGRSCTLAPAGIETKPFKPPVTKRRRQTAPNRHNFPENETTIKPFKPFSSLRQPFFAPKPSPSSSLPEQKQIVKVCKR